MRITWIPDPTDARRDEPFPCPWLGPAPVATYARLLGIPEDPEIQARLDGHELRREEWDCALVGEGADLRFIRWPAGLGAILAMTIGGALATTTTVGVGAAATAITTLTALGTIFATAVDLLLSAGLSYLASLFQEKPQDPPTPRDFTYSPHGMLTNHNPHGAAIPLPLGDVIVPGAVIEQTTGHLGGTLTPHGPLRVQIGGQRSLSVYCLGQGPIHAVDDIAQDVDGLGFGREIQPQNFYNRLSPSPLGAVALKTTESSDPKAVHKLAFWFVLPLPPQETERTYYVDEIRLTLRRVHKPPYPTPTGSLKVWIEAPTFDRSHPSGVPLCGPLEVPLTAINTQGFENQIFKLPRPVALAGTSYHYWLLVEADYPVSTTSYVEVGYVSTLDESNLRMHPGGGGSWWYDAWLGLAAALIGIRPRRYLGTGIRVGGTALQNFGTEGTLCVRLGSRDQRAIPFLAGITIESPIDVALPRDNPITQTTTEAVTSVGFVLGFPQGYYHQRREGRQEATEFRLRVRWRAHGTEPWAGNYEWDKEDLLFPTPGVLSIRLLLDEPLRGQKIDVELTHLTPKAFSGPSAVDWVSLQEFGEGQAQTHPHLALAAIDADVINATGNWDNLTFRIRGLRIRYASAIDAYGNLTWHEGYTDNPVDHLINLLLNVHYGGGRTHRMTLDNVDWEAAIAARDYCDQSIHDRATGRWMPRWVISLNIDTVRPWWEWCRVIAAAARLKLIPVGNKVKIKADCPRPLTKVFSVGDIVEGSFRRLRSSLRQRPTRVVVRYFDREERDWSHAIAEDLEARANKLEVVEEEVELLGVPDKHRAARHAQCLLNRARLIKARYEFACFVDAATCEKGDVVGVQSDVPAWEQTGGRVIEGDADRLRIDRDLVLDDSADPYFLTYWTTDEVTGLDVVVTREVVRGSGPFPKTIPKGDWIDVLEIFPGGQWPKGPEHSPLSAGDPYAIRPVRDPAAPQLGVKLVEVTDMTLTDDIHVKLTAVDYDERVFDDEPSPQDRTPTPAVPRTLYDVPDAPQSLALTSTIAEDDQFVVLASWEPALWDWPYKIAVFVRQENIGQVRWRRDGTVDSSVRTYVLRGVAPNQTYSVALCPIAPATVDRHYHPDSDRVARSTVRVREAIDRPDSVLNFRASV